jgi:hypothetical protein
MRRTASNARRLVARATYEGGTLLGRYAWLVVPIARWRGHGVPVGRRTDLVIEGFPRSGNTFTVAAVSSAQPGPLRIAHHVHAPGNVFAAVHSGLPTIVLIAPPRAAVGEFATGKPDLTVGQVLRGWIRFYAPLVPVLDRLVVATADQVAADLTDVIRRVNARFGTALHDVAGTDEAVRRVREVMDAYVRNRSGPGLPLVGRSGHEATDAERERVRRGYDSPRFTSLRARAERLHEAFVEHAG